MASQSKAPKATTERVMHEYKTGNLMSGSGRKVTSRRQALAIALDESNSTGRESPKDNRRTLRRIASRERAGRIDEAEKEGRSGQRRTLKTGADGISRRRSTGSSARQTGPAKAELMRAACRRKHRWPVAHEQGRTTARTETPDPVRPGKFSGERRGENRPGGPP